MGAARGGSPNAPRGHGLPQLLTRESVLKHRTIQDVFQMDEYLVLKLDNGHEVRISGPQHTTGHIDGFRMLVRRPGEWEELG